MNAYLIDNPPRIRQFRERGTTVSGVVVVHTAESTPDTIGPDQGAEGVARFIRDRTTYGSYHDLVDSDGVLSLVPYHLQAYGDGTGSNPHAMHLSFATTAARWPSLPAAWVEDALEQAARAAHRMSDYLESVHGVRIPARRVTRAQSDQRVEGFISHGERDPGRRTDPGASFPWDRFLELYRDLESPAKPAPPSRGGAVDKALRKLSGAISELEDAKAPKGSKRATLIAGALGDARAARADLRSIAYLKAEK